MKKFIIFLFGFVVGVVSIIATITLMLFNVAHVPTPNGPGNRSNLFLIGEPDENVPVHLTLDLGGLPPDRLPPSPWRVGAVVTTSTRPWTGQVGTKYKNLEMVSVTSFPADVTFMFNHDHQLGPILASGDVERKSAGFQELSFTFFLCGSTECVNFFEGKALSDLNRFDVNPPYLLQTEVFKSLPTDFLLKPGKKSIEIGKVYFRDYFDPKRAVRAECPPGGQKLKVVDVKKFLPAVAHGKKIHVVRVLDVYQYLRAYRSVTSAAGNDSYRDLYLDLGEIHPAGDSVEVQASANLRPEIGGIYANYYLVLCGAQENKEACLERFGKNYYRDRRLSQKGEFYPLVPKSREVPRCDDPREVTLYAYPFEGDITNPNQYRPYDSNHEIPWEIVDAQPGN